MANTYKAFKGILQYKSTDKFTKQAGYIYFVREFKDGKETNNAEVWFGTRKYGDINTTGLAELQRQITANADNITSINEILGQWSEKFKGDISTVASAVVAVSGATETNKSDIASLKTLVGENNVSDSINNAKTEAIETSTGYTQTQINTLNANVTGNSDHITVNVVEENGKITTVNVSEENIASNSDLTTHTNNTTIHITAEDRTAWNNTKKALDAFLLNSDATTNAIDTLKEIQDFLTSDNGTVDKLLDDVSTNATNIQTVTTNFNAHSANTEIHVTAADKTKWNAAEQNAKDYADGIKTDLVGNAAEDYNTLGKLEDKIQAVAQSVTEKNVSAEGDGTYITASADKNKVTVTATKKTTNAIALAETALQKNDIAEGTANGTISVKGENVAVHGLGSAAYTNSDAYDTAGAANTAEGNAKSYTDGLLGEGFSTSNTVSSVIDEINKRLTAITDTAVISVNSSGGTITVTDVKGDVNVEVNTLAHAENGQDGYVILNKTNDGALYGVMYYGGDDAE